MKARSDKSRTKIDAGAVRASSKAAANLGDVNWLTVRNARHNNLRGIDVAFPLGRFIAVTGVSGSGKSSLVNDILRESLAAQLNKAQTEPGAHDGIDGIEHLDKIIDIDQSPIGRTPRSNPATYIKLFDRIRDLYTQLPQAKARGYKAGRFSFNVPSGRCESCEGNGSNKLEMDFLADVWVTCSMCEGRRFNRETLQVRFKDKSIHDVLEMDVQEALVQFENVTPIQSMLATLHDVGLDYVKLGQPSPTLSGGEAQRIKLARELCKKSTGRTLYVLDEPTTGLHFEDVKKLLGVLHGFVDAGNTVIVIEHNLDVVKTADWVIDLGPEGGADGGGVVVAGTPEDVARCDASHTGVALRPMLDPKRKPAAALARSATKTKGKRVVPSNGIPRSAEYVIVEGARQHNLKDVSVEIPQRKMTVFCGPSGSGKSSLAIDTLYAEGQRRYVESLSSYARQFLGQVQKPVVERVAGLSPAICIEQKPPSKSPRSTVGTVTEIYDYFRVLFARLGQPHCPDCNVPVGTQTGEEIVDKLMLLPDGAKVYLMAPIQRQSFDDYESLWEELKRTGFVRMRVDGKTHEVDAPPAINRRRKHEVEVVIDRATIRHNQRSRIADSVEAGLELGRGLLHVALVEDGVDERKWKVERFSKHFACDRCGRSFTELTPNHFSFNSPLGWCPTCEGLGVQAGGSAGSVTERAAQSIRQGAIAAFGNLFDPENPMVLAMEAVARHGGFSLDEPFWQLAAESKRIVLSGAGNEWLELGDGLGTRFQYKGVYPAIGEATRVSWVYRNRLADLVGEVACSTCDGSRLRDDAAAMRFADRTIGQWCELPMDVALRTIVELKLEPTQRKIAGELLREIENRIRFLVDVGLEYLTLARPTPSLSGGEAQRIRLASQLGSGLTGVLYLLDEPTIGLHPRDNGRLLAALQKLRNLNNTLILVEHDREVIDAADFLLDFGPGAGKLGGEIVAQGTPAKVKNQKSSLTGRYLKGIEAIPVPDARRTSTKGALEIIGASHNNLRNIDVAFPLGCLIAVTGVSGSGKSSLINDILWATLAKRLHRAQTAPGLHEEIRGIELIDKVISVDQQPIGNAPSSNPATYTGAFDLIRELFAKLPDSKVRGYPASRFSFNKPGGRCEVCEGNGQKKIEMHFLPDVWVECDACKGKRYTADTLAVKFHGKSIADVLEMGVAEARALFANVPKIRKLLDTLRDVGLDYMALGQAAPTMSGGEAQRVKLAAELARPNTGKTLYVLDEPTTGLHFDDLRKLLIVLHRLVDLGNTVVCIEHNLDVIKTADWIIDVGPEAGEGGGQIVFAGTPEELAATVGGKLLSHTAAALAPVLAAGPRRPRETSLPSVQEAAGDEDSFGEIGADVSMPWEIDGARWHCVDRLSRRGKPARWEGEALRWLVDKIQAIGVFSPTNWNDRTLVSIDAARKSDGWFLHALTGEEWLLRLRFRTARGSFKTELLDRKLGLKPLDQMKEIPRYGSEPRVRVRQERTTFQMVEMSIYRLEEIDTPAFAEFLEKAVAGFHKSIDKLAAKPDETQPWTADGEAWHLSERGFKPGRKVRWDRSIVRRVFACIAAATDEAGWQWDFSSRDSAKRRHKKVGMAWARVMTKQSRSLEIHLVGPKSAFNLAAIDHLGADREIRNNAERYDAIRIDLQTDDDFSANQLSEFLAGHAAKFLAAFG